MIRVMLVDDEELVRTGLRMILDAEPELTVVGEAADGVEALGGELVQMRCRSTPAMKADISPAKVVGHDENHVGPVGVSGPGGASAEGRDQHCK